MSKIYVENEEYYDTMNESRNSERPLFSAPRMSDVDSLPPYIVNEEANYSISSTTCPLKTPFKTRGGKCWNGLLKFFNSRPLLFFNVAMMLLSLCFLFYSLFVIVPNRLDDAYISAYNESNAIASACSGALVTVNEKLNKTVAELQAAEKGLSQTQAELKNEKDTVANQKTEISKLKSQVDSLQAQIQAQGQTQPPSSGGIWDDIVHYFSGASSAHPSYALTVTCLSFIIVLMLNAS